METSPQGPSADARFEIDGIPINLAYLAEGAANVVYRISPGQSGHPLRPPLSDSVLRLRKDTRFSVPYSDTVHFFHNNVTGLFPPESLVHLKLWPITDAQVITSLNDELRKREREGTRPAKRSGVFLTSGELNAILVTDMTANGPHEKFTEFKPKWLLQSPSAPRGAKRCRTCALKVMQRSKGEGGGRGEGEFCPLDLVSKDEGVARCAARRIDSSTDFQDIFLESVQPLLEKLRRLQKSHGKVGLGDFEQLQDSIDAVSVLDGPDLPARIRDMAMAMTLRDCSFFVRYRPGSGAALGEVRLADLDAKLVSRQNLQKWANVERQLIQGGWYEGTEDHWESNGRHYCRALGDEGWEEEKDPAPN